MKFDVQKLQEPLLKVSAWVEGNTILQAVKMRLSAPSRLLLLVHFQI